MPQIRSLSAVNAIALVAIWPTLLVLAAYVLFCVNMGQLVRPFAIHVTLFPLAWAMLFGPPTVLLVVWLVVVALERRKLFLRL